MTAYRTPLLLLSGFLLAVSAAAQPRLHAPDPSAYRQPDLNARFDTRGDRHPHVEHGRDGSLVFRNEDLVAELVRGQDGAYGPLTLYPASRPTQPWNAPVAVVEEFLTLDGPDGTPVHFRPRSAEVKGDDQVLLRGDAGEGASHWPVEVTLSIGRDPWLSWNVRVLGRAGSALRTLLPMQTRIGHEGPRTVLLPGIAFAERTENVSGYPLPDITPDPTQITVPLVAAAQGDTTVALMWDPAQAWGGPGAPTVAARFPAGIKDAAAIVSLSAPAPSGSASPTPVNVPAGKSLNLSGKLLVVRETENVASAVRQWDAAYSSRKTELHRIEQDLGVDRDGGPHILRSWDQSRALARKAYAAHPVAAASPADNIARDAEVLDVLAQLLDAGEERAPHGGPIRSSVDAALNRLAERGPLDPRLAYRTGSVNSSLGALQAQVRGLIRSQLVRGSWPLGIPSKQPDFTEDLRIVPEKPEDVEVGTVTQNALPILQYGAITGDSDAIGAGIRALEYIDRLADRRPYGRFRVPAGAETQFSQKPVATLYSATQAAECFLLGYQATGQLRYLESARYWADTGLPFIYSWNDARRPALRGASVAHFYASPSDDAAPGRASQRVGLYYARMLQRLAQVRPDDFYDRVVRAITASALQQQPATGANAGLLPESWDVRESRPIGGWLTPGPLLAVQASTNRYNMDVSHVRVRTGSDRIVVASGAQIDRPTTSAMRLRLNLRWANGEESYTTVTGVAARPIRVEYNSEILPVIRVPVSRHYLPEANDEFGPGWYFDDDTGLLTIRVRHTSGDDHLEVRWPDPRERTPVDRVDIRVRNNR